MSLPYSNSKGSARKMSGLFNVTRPWWCLNRIQKEGWGLHGKSPFQSGQTLSKTSILKYLAQKQNKDSLQKQKSVPSCLIIHKQQKRNVFSKL